jgi:hypothetical protein
MIVVLPYDRLRGASGFDRDMRNASPVVNADRWQFRLDCKVFHDMIA